MISAPLVYLPSGVVFQSVNGAFDHAFRLTGKSYHAGQSWAEQWLLDNGYRWPYLAPGLESWQQIGALVEVEGVWTHEVLERPTILEEMWQAIKTERERRRVGGVLVAEKWFHSDDPSRIQHIGLVMMGASMPAGIQWKTMDGSFVEMTPTLAGQIFNALALADTTNFAVAEQHRLAMEAAVTPGAYDYSGGWLPIYGG